MWSLNHGGRIPSSLAEAGVSDSGDATLEYWRTSGGSVYCLAAVPERGNAYFIRSNKNEPQSAGKCSDPISIVGVEKPLGFNEAQGTTVTLDSPVSGTPDLILYGVFESPTTNANYNSISSFSPISAGNRMQLDASASGDTSMRYRLDSSAINNASASQPNIKGTPQKHIGWVQVRNGMTIREFAYDKASAHNSSSFAPGDGWNFSGLSLYTDAGTSLQPIATLAYDEAHTQAQRTAVLEWLSQKYAVGLSL